MKRIVFVPEPPKELAHFTDLDPCCYLEETLRYAAFELAIRGFDTRVVHACPDLFVQAWKRLRQPPIVELEKSGPRRFAMDLPTPCGIVRVVCDASLGEPLQP